MLNVIASVCAVAAAISYLKLVSRHMVTRERELRRSRWWAGQPLDPADSWMNIQAMGSSEGFCWGEWWPCCCETAWFEFLKLITGLSATAAAAGPTTLTYHLIHTLMEMMNMNWNLNHISCGQRWLQALLAVWVDCANTLAAKALIWTLVVGHIRTYPQWPRSNCLQLPSLRQC